jgi:hypothetical protein
MVGTTGRIVPVNLGDNMRRECFRRVSGLAVLASVIFFFGCARKPAKGVMVFSNGGLKVVSAKIEDDGRIPNPGEPGWVILFRTDGKTLGDEAGKAGTAYTITDQKKLSKIGEFDLKKSDEELAKE